MVMSADGGRLAYEARDLAATEEEMGPSAMA